MNIEFFYLKSAVEIIFLSSIVYFFSLWLKKDKRHNLLIYFYGYCAIFSLATLLNLATITAFLMYSTPLALILFIIFHQDILQRNFVTMCNKSIALPNQTSDWLDNLIRSSLFAINNNKQLIVVIEDQADLKPFLETTFIFQCPLSQNLLTLLIESNNFDHNKMLWCNTQGQLVGINASWNITHHDFLQTAQELPTWLQDALLMTLKTDTIVFNVNPLKRAFDIVIKGTLYEAVAAPQALSLIKKQLVPSTSQKGDISHVNNRQKQHFEQQNN